MNQADTVWILVATALVFFMTMPGLALFYGGMVRAKNVVNMFIQCYVIACIVMVLWYLVGYSIAYGPDAGLWGGIGKAALMGVSDTSMVGNLPEFLFFIFQMTFAVITSVLIVGACAERVKFGFIVAFCSLWMVFVYAPVAHWVWGGGMLSDGGILGAVGVRDYAGGLVVHATAGVAALVLAVVIGPRKDTETRAHSPGMVMTGAAMLWVGWIGFNGGSALAADAVAVRSVLVTMLAGAAGSLSWLAWEYVRTQRCTMVGLATGTLAGLAAITPAAGFVGPGYALMIGLISGMMCLEGSVLLKQKLKIDDSLDVVAVHGLGGIYGSLMIAPLGVATWASQLIGIAFIIGYTIAVTIVLVFFCKGIFGIRVSQKVEMLGLDQLIHGQKGYALQD